MQTQANLFNPQEISLYEQDFYQWTIEQSTALQERQIDQLDWENLTEEIEALGKEQLPEDSPYALEEWLKD